ncbi:MAG: hypothetical protein LBV74_22005 [Tannerella sp.]|jgi:glycosyltransferase involved in cell wall biosynthesis|nr:hypothetical protein [Tannerella sp.]
MKIAILTSDPQSIFWHRQDLADDFVKAKHDLLIISSGNEEWVDKFHQYGFRYKYIRLNRNGINPITDIYTFLDFIKVLKEEKPDKVFAYQAKAVVYGCWAANRCGITEVYTMLTGLGSVLRDNKKTLKHQLLSFILKRLYKNAFRCSRVVVFQNKDDQDIMINATSLPLNKTVLVNGSGVDINTYIHRSLPSTPTFLYIGRLVEEKESENILRRAKSLKINIKT